MDGLPWQSARISRIRSTSGPVLREVSLPSLKVPAPPLSEEIVAFRVERAPLVEPADVGHAFLDSAAAFQDQGAVAVLGQEVAGDQTGRAGADDHGPVVQRS